MSEENHVAPEEISWADFEKVCIVAGTVVRVEPFPEARKPAWKVWVDFGPYGERKTSAQITQRRRPTRAVVVSVMPRSPVAS